MQLPGVRFKTERIRREYELGYFYLRGDEYVPLELDPEDMADPHLVRVDIHFEVYVQIDAVNRWIYCETGRPAELTELGRSHRETIAAYSPNPAPGSSPHEVGRAFDISLKRPAVPADRAHELERWSNSRFRYVAGNHSSAIVHKVGNSATHYHGQVSPGAIIHLPQGLSNH